MHAVYRNYGMVTIAMIEHLSKRVDTKKKQLRKGDKGLQTVTCSIAINNIQFVYFKEWVKHFDHLKWPAATSPAIKKYNIKCQRGQAVMQRYFIKVITSSYLFLFHIRWSKGKKDQNWRIKRKRKRRTNKIQRSR